MPLLETVGVKSALQSYALLPSPELFLPCLWKRGACQENELGEEGSRANGKLIPGGEGQRLLFVMYNLLFVSNCVLCISVGWQENRDLLLRV